METPADGAIPAAFSFPVARPGRERMKTSAAGIAFLKMWEGFSPRAYQDVAGVWTIGYGHTEGFRTGRFAEGSSLSESAGEALLREDLAPREAAIGALVAVSLNQNEFDALVSFVFNVGVGGFRRSSVRRRLNEGARIGAGDAFLLWNKARIGGRLREVRGLTRRRHAERALFLGAS